MKFEYWQTVPRDLPCKDLDGLCVLAYADGSDNGVWASFAKAEYDPLESTLIATYRYTSKLGFATTERLMLTLGHPCTTIWARLEWMLSSRDIHMVVVPRVRQSQPRPLTWISIAYSLVLALITTFLVVQASGTVAAVLALPIGTLVGLGSLFVASRTWKPTIAAAGRLELTGDNMVDYARQRARGERPELDRSAERKAALTEQIEAIKDAYAQLSTDIVYRIENSAMFDSSVSTTQRFEGALWRVNNEGLPTMGLIELEDAATELEISFSVARDNAETLGLAHLPETVRPAAGRASRAARLALRTTSAGEREVSMAQVAKILDELSIHFLPKVSPETLAIEPPR